MSKVLAWFSQSATDFWSPNTTAEIAKSAALEAQSTAKAMGMPDSQVLTAGASAIGAVYANAKTQNM